jgi:cell division protein FtsB
MDDVKYLYKLLVKMAFKTLIISYCVFHFCYGNYGYISYKNSQKDFIHKKNFYDNQLKQNEKKKNKISRLSRTSLDLELLDEEIKKNTSIVKKNEIIIFSDDFKK